MNTDAEVEKNLEEIRMGIEALFNKVGELQTENEYLEKEVRSLVDFLNPKPVEPIEVVIAT